MSCFNCAPHEDSLIAQMQRVLDHHSNNITILQEPDLLGELQQLVTTKPSTVIASSTGIPPHVETNRNLTTAIGDMCQVLDLQKGMDATISDAMGIELMNRNNPQWLHQQSFQIPSLMPMREFKKRD